MDIERFAFRLWVVISALWVVYVVWVNTTAQSGTSFAPSWYVGPPAIAGVLVLAAVWVLKGLRRL